MNIQGEGNGGSSPTTEATLCAQAQAGNLESLNQLIDQHERLVWFVVSRQRLWGLPTEEARQAGRHGLWRAVLGYDPSRGAAFATYAYVAILKYVWAAVQSHLRQQRREVPLDVLGLYFCASSPDPAWLQHQQDLSQALQALLARLPRRLRRVIVARYGLNGQEPQTLRAIGAQLELTGERVRQLQLEALVWLRQPAHSQELRSLLARHNQTQYELADKKAQAWLTRRGGRHGKR